MSPADLFLDLWKFLEGIGSALPSLRPERTDAALRVALAGQLRAERFDYDAALSLIGDVPGRRLVAAQTVDAHYSRLSGGHSVVGLSKPLAAARRQLRETGRLNLSSEGRAVILRRPLAGRWSSDQELPEPEGVGAFFDTLLVTPETVSSTHPDDPLQPTTVRLRFTVPPPGMVRALRLDRPWKLGLAPVLQDVSELELRIVEEAQGARYDSVACDLEMRIGQIVETLCRAGCNVIALPEMALSPKSLAALKAAVALHGPSSRLRFVLAGSTRTIDAATGNPLNRSCTLNHKGDVLYEQDKLARWNLDRPTCGRYGLAPPSSDSLDEHIQVGSEIVVAELPGIGRLATLICEDLGRTEPGRWIRRHLLLDLQYTPVMDSDLHLGRWTARSGATAASVGGCRVMVVNSLPLSLRQNDVNAAEGTGPVVVDHGIGLLFDRDQGDVRALRVSTSAGVVPTASCEHVDWEPSRWEPFTLT